MVEITQHAMDRARERLGLNNGAFTRLAEKAFSEGLCHRETRGKLKAYITGLWENNMNVNNIRIYGEFIYFFAGVTLVTVYIVPQELRKKALKKFINKRSLNNA